MSEVAVEKLAVLANQLASLTDELTREVMSHQSDDHLALVRYFDKFRKSADTFSDAKKAITELHDRMSREFVPDAMRAADVKTVNIVGIGRVSISHRFSCSIVSGMKDTALEWLRGHNLGGIIQETVNSSTLSATAKRMIEEEGKDLPDDIFKVSTSPYTSITATK